VTAIAARQVATSSGRDHNKNKPALHCVWKQEAESSASAVQSMKLLLMIKNDGQNFFFSLAAVKPLYGGTSCFHTKPNPPPYKAGYRPALLKGLLSLRF